MAEGRNGDAVEARLASMREKSRERRREEFREAMRDVAAAAEEVVVAWDTALAAFGEQVAELVPTLTVEDAGRLERLKWWLHDAEHGLVTGGLGFALGALVVLAIWLLELV